MYTKTFAVAAALALVMAAGCGGGSAPSGTGAPKPAGGAAPAKKETKAKAASTEAYAKDKHKGSIKGVVSLEGVAKQKQIDTAGDPKCHAMHAASPLLTEDIVVKDGKLKNVIVHLKSGTNKFSYETPAQPAILDQKGCQYVPHVFAVMVDQQILVKNSDALTHNVHGISPTKDNSEFNISQANQGAEDKKKLGNPELPYTIQCDVHKWMNAKVGVFDHPFFAVTGDDGSFEIQGVPAGDYEVEAWHETLKTQMGKVTVKDGAVEQNFSFKK